MSKITNAEFLNVKEELNDCCVPAKEQKQFVLDRIEIVLKTIGVLKEKIKLTEKEIEREEEKMRLLNGFLERIEK